MAAEISRDYAGKRPLLLCMLKGAIIFMADLVREIEDRQHLLPVFPFDVEKANMPNNWLKFKN